MSSFTQAMADLLYAAIGHLHNASYSALDHVHAGALTQEEADELTGGEDTDQHSHAGAGGYTEGAHVYHNANQNITKNQWTDLAFNSERWDTDTMHDTSTNNERLTCKTAGKYIIVGSITFAGNAAGNRTVAIFQNNATYKAVDTRANLGSDAVQLVVVAKLNLAVNDYVTLRVVHSSTVNINVNYAGDYSPEFSMQRIG